MIRQDMLVVESTDLNVGGQRRKGIFKIAIELSEMVIKCEEEKGYI